MMSYEVVDRETGRAISVRSLYDALGNYKPHDPGWQARYYLREPGTVDEIELQPATQADEIDEIADEAHVLADRLRDIADKMRGIIDE